MAPESKIAHFWKSLRGKLIVESRLFAEWPNFNVVGGGRWETGVGFSRG